MKRILYLILVLIVVTLYIQSLDSAESTIPMGKTYKPIDLTFPQTTEREDWVNRYND